MPRLPTCQPSIVRRADSHQHTVCSGASVSLALLLIPSLSLAAYSGPEVLKAYEVSLSKLQRGETLAVARHQHRDFRGAETTQHSASLYARWDDDALVVGVWGDRPLSGADVPRGSRPAELLHGLEQRKLRTVWQRATADGIFELAASPTRKGELTYTQYDVQPWGAQYARDFPWLDSGSCLRGFFFAMPVNLLHALSQSENLTVAPGTVVVGQQECLRADATGKYGRWTVWFAPQRGMLPVRVEVRQEPGDLYGYSTVWDFHKTNARDRGTSQVLVVEYQLDETSGTWFGRRVDLTQRVVHTNGETRSTRIAVEATFKPFQFRPPAETFQLVIPDGIEALRVVGTKGRTDGIPYIYRGGALAANLPNQLVSAIDAEIIKRRVELAPESTSTAFASSTRWLIVVLALAVAGALVVVRWKFAKSRPMRSAET